MRKTFLVAVVVNLFLLVAYEVGYYLHLLDFINRTFHPDDILFSWTPFIIQIRFDVPMEAVSPAYYGYGSVSIHNFIFSILVAIACFNLFVIWKLEKNQSNPE